jgi:hypothetical protein
MIHPPVLNVRKGDPPDFCHRCCFLGSVTHHRLGFGAFRKCRMCGFAYFWKDCWMCKRRGEKPVFVVAVDTNTPDGRFRHRNFVEGTVAVHDKDWVDRHSGSFREIDRYISNPPSVLASFPDEKDFYPIRGCFVYGRCAGCAKRGRGFSFYLA